MQDISSTNTRSVPGGIDLHSHTTASDGSLTPTELVHAAQELGLAALGVTDHDTLGGLGEARIAAEQCGLDLVNGVELSVEDDAGRFHLLGYLFNPADAKLSEALITIRASRARRNDQMAVKMAELGLPVTMGDVRAEAGDKGEVIARPHFAKALMKKGVVTSVQDAFDRFLATGKPLYMPKEVLTPKEAIALIHGAGGIALMAHPGLVPMGDDALAERIKQLKETASMDGIEGYYSQHSPAQTQRFLELARSLDLLISGGSDFHGTPKPHVPLGIVHDGRSASPELLKTLRSEIQKRQLQ